MCAALYIVTEREIPGFDTFVSGKALSRAEPQLAAIAAQLGVTPLLEFCSIGSEDASAFLEAEGVDAGDVEFSPEAWFEADAGLASVNAVDKHVASSPDAITTSPQI